MQTAINDFESVESQNSMLASDKVSTIVCYNVAQKYVEQTAVKM